MESKCNVCKKRSVSNCISCNHVDYYEYTTDDSIKGQLPGIKKVIYRYEFYQSGYLINTISEIGYIGRKHYIKNKNKKNTK